MTATRAPHTGSTVDAEEVRRFSRLAASWWDENGSMRMLHRLNPVRIGYIRDQATAHFGRDQRALDSLAAQLRGLGATVTPRAAPFEPEPGAYHRHEH